MSTYLHLCTGVSHCLSPFLAFYPLPYYVYVVIIKLHTEHFNLNL